MTDYHEGLPVMPPAKVAEVADRLRIQIIGVRAGWAAWAARQTDLAREAAGDLAANRRWQDLMAVDTALRGAEAQLEAAMEKIAEVASDGT